MMKSQEWQSIFGPVDFTDEFLFKHMVYLHPQPRSSFNNFSDEILSKGIRFDHKLWITRLFKGPFLATLLKLTPTGYYLNEGRTEHSLLLYETQYEQNEISLIENSNIIFLTIKPNGYSAEKGIAREDMINILTQWTKVVRGKKNEFFEKFSFPEVLKAYYVFANNKGIPLFQFLDWRDNIVGFIADSGVSFMFFKAQPNRAMKGIHSDFNWLNKGLFKNDEKTLVDPPR